MPVISLHDHDAPGCGERDATAAIQAALDACAAAGGGRVVVPAPGRYLCGSIFLRSHVELHLEAGATLLAIPDVDRFRVVPTGRFWINAEDCVNVAITGLGTIDGQAVRFMKEERPEGFNSRPGCQRALAFINCHGVRITGITIRETSDWAIHPVGCEDVVIDGITIRNNLKVPNCDGIDPDRCRNVRISNCHIESGDDGIVIKCRKEWDRFSACERITVTNCTIISTSCGIKIGTETHDDIRDVTISNCVVYGSNRGLGVCHRDAGTIENILFSDIVVETRLFHDKWWGKAEPIYVTALPRAHGAALGPLRNVRFRNILARGEKGIYIQGCDQVQPDDLVLQDIRLELAKTTRWPADRCDPRPCPPDLVPVGGQPIGPITDWGNLVQRDQPAIYLERVGRIRLRDIDIRWQGDMPACYTHALEAWQVADLDLRDLRGTAARPGLPALMRDGRVWPSAEALPDGG